MRKNYKIKVSILSINYFGNALECEVRMGCGLGCVCVGVKGGECVLSTEGNKGKEGVVNLGMRPNFLRRAHIVAADNRRKATNVKIAKLWRQSDGKRGISKIHWRVVTTFNDNTTARDEWLRQGTESSEQNRTLSGRWVTMSRRRHQSLCVCVCGLFK